MKKIIQGLKEIGKGFLAPLGLAFIPIFIFLVWMTKDERIRYRR